MGALPVGCGASASCALRAGDRRMGTTGRVRAIPCPGTVLFPRATSGSTDRRAIVRKRAAVSCLQIDDLIEQQVAPLAYHQFVDPRGHQARKGGSSDTLSI